MYKEKLNREICTKIAINRDMDAKEVSTHVDSVRVEHAELDEQYDIVG